MFSRRLDILQEVFGAYVANFEPIGSLEKRRFCSHIRMMHVSNYARLEKYNDFGLIR